MFDELYDAILKLLTASFPKIPCFSAYPDGKKIERVPSIFFEMTEFTPRQDPGTGELEILSSFEARVIVSPAVDRHQLVAANIAAKMAVLIHNQTFVAFGKPCDIVSCSDDVFERMVAGHIVWVCEWTQVLRIGDNKWDDANFYPENARLTGPPPEAVHA